MNNTKIKKYLLTIILTLSVLEYASANFLTKFLNGIKKNNSVNNIKTENISADDFTQVKDKLNNKDIGLKTNIYKEFKLFIHKLLNKFKKDKWDHLTTKQLNKRFKEYLNSNLGVGIRQCQVFVPSNCKDKDLSNLKPTVIFVIHGTYAQNSKSYYDISKKFYSSILDYAQKLADIKQSPIEVVSFQWQGINSSDIRVDASELLAKVINENYSNYRVITIAHSHGCNVVNNASQKLAAGVEISKMIHLACPVRETAEQDNKYTPKNFKKLYQFYSTSDLVAAAGSITTNKYLPTDCRKFKNNSAIKVKNIRTMTNGYDVGHCNIKEYVAPYLFEILNDIDKNYTLNNDLELNIENNNIMTAIRHDRNFITEEDINHLKLKMQKLNHKIYNNLNKIEILNTNLIEENNLLLKDLTNKNEKYFTRRNNLNTKLNNIEEAIKTESKYSDKQKDLFKKIYNFDMSNKGNMAYRVLNGLYQDLFNR